MAGTCTSERNNRGSGCRSGSNGTVVPNTFSSSIDPAVCRSVFVNGPSGASITLADTGECPCKGFVHRDLVPGWLSPLQHPCNCNLLCGHAVRSGLHGGRPG